MRSFAIRATTSLTAEVGDYWAGDDISFGKVAMPIRFDIRSIIERSSSVTLLVTTTDLDSRRSVRDALSGGIGDEGRAVSVSTRGHTAIIGSVLTIAAALLLVLAATASANYWRQCGSQNHLGAGWYNARAHGISCPKARAVAKRYAHSFDTSPYGFACGYRTLGEEAAAVRCGRTRDGVRQKVAFKVGA